MTSAPASLAASAPAALSDETVETLLRLSKLAQSAGDTSHHELMAQVVEAGARR